MINKIDTQTVHKIVEILKHCPATVSISDALTEKLKNIDTDRPCLIAVAGESGAGKTTLLSKIQRCLPEATFFSTDNYFKDFSQYIKIHGSFDALLAAGYDIQAPFSIHLDLLAEDLKALKEGHDVLIPEHLLDGSGVTTLKKILVPTSPIVFVDGFCTLYEPVREIFDFVIFLEPNPDKEYMLNMLMQRQMTQEQALKVSKILNVSSMTYIKPTEQYADIVLNVFDKDIAPTMEQIMCLFQQTTTKEQLMNKLRNPTGDLALLWNRLSDSTRAKIIDELTKESS